MSIAEYSPESLPKSAPVVRPIRVCYLIDNLAIGGTEKQLLALIAHLDRSQVQPYLCLLDGTGNTSQSLEPADCPVLRLGVKSLRSIRAVSAAWRFVRFLRQQKIDIVQLHFPDSTYFGAPLAKLAGVKCVLRTRRNTGYWITRRHRWAGRVISCLVDATIANSEACRQAVIEQEGARPESVHVIPNGVDLERFNEDGRTLRARRNPHKCVGIVANLRPVKNLELFLHAAAILKEKHPNLMFCIAGKGEQLWHLESLAQQLGVNDRVQFMGEVNDVPGLLKGFDVAVLTSDSEGFSNSLIEYMASGLPVVATDLSANRELVTHEVTGLLVTRRNVQALASAIDRLLCNNSLADRVGVAAARKVRQYYSRSIEVERHLGLYITIFCSKLQGSHGYGHMQC